MSVQIVVFNQLGSLASDIEHEVRCGIEDGVSAFDRYLKVELNRTGFAGDPNS